MRNPELLPSSAAVWLLLPIAISSHAQTAAPASPEAPTVQLEQVEIRGRTRTETDIRRESTAAKTVVGREELERYGDGSVADVLKRLPGVTVGGRPGRGGEIRMRGLGSGYTQILINGERTPGGLSIDTLTPEQVERIEVYRAPTAETGAQAIAGTINIVLREDVRKRLNTLQLGLGWADDRWTPSLSWTRADRIDAFSYNLSLSAYRRDRVDHVDTHTEAVPQDTGVPSDVRDEQRLGRGLRQGVHLGGRLQWKLDDSNTLALQPFVMVQNERDQSSTQLEPSVGIAPYASANTHSHGHFAMFRSNAEWQLRLPDAARLELNGGAGANESVGYSRRLENDLNRQVSRQVSDASDAQERYRSLRGKYSRPLDLDHQLAMGWEAEQGHREEVRNTEQSLPALTPVNDQLRVQTLRTSLWGQDEWKLSPQWSLQGGLRWEAISTHSSWLDSSQWASSRNRSAVWSPLFHALWRPREKAQDQVRLSLTRSYRAPRPAQLSAQRVYARDIELTGSNTPNNPDTLGNPSLRPELSTGLDLAYEHYLSAGGVLSASVFHRQISDYIRNVTSLESSTGRYITQPQNIGNASTSGVELEAKFRVSELSLGLDWPLDLRSSVSFFRSRVASIPGPDNRLDKQPRYTANLGADYKLRSWPLQLGSNLSLQPGNPLQVSDTQRSYEDLRRVVDAYALWTFNPNTALRLSINNGWARSTHTASDYSTAPTLSTPSTAYSSRSTEDNTTLVALRLELKL